MNEKELVKEVLAAEMARRTLERDRRRLQLLSAFTIFLWIAVLVIGVLLFDVFWRTVSHIYSDVAAQEEMAATNKLAPPAVSTIPPVFQGNKTIGRQFQMEIAALHKGIAVVTSCIIVIGLAALSTMLLILLSRRTTLRHVDAGLADIAEQLKQLRDSGPKG
jgi:hypothetical protein